MKKFINTTCISYTVVILICTILSKVNLVQQITTDIILQLFTIVVSISLLMHFTKKLSLSVPITILLEITVCYFVVFLEGGLFGLFPMNLDTFIGIAPITIPAFGCSYLISYRTMKADADFINKKIKDKQTNK